MERIDYRIPGLIWKSLSPTEEEQSQWGKPTRWWGGRYLFSANVDVKLDLPGDRQNYIGPRDGVDAFVRWLNERLDPLLVQALETERITTGSSRYVTVQEGRFMAWATPAASYDYLYVGAWEFPEPDGEEG